MLKPTKSSKTTDQLQKNPDTPSTGQHHWTRICPIELRLHGVCNGESGLRDFSESCLQAWDSSALMEKGKPESDPSALGCGCARASFGSLCHPASLGLHQ